MKPNPKLLEVLKNVRNKIEKHPDAYFWSMCGQCNCGLVVSEILNIQSTKITESFRKINFGRSWTKVSKSEDVIPEEIRGYLKALESVGIEKADVQELEFLGYPTTENGERTVFYTSDMYVDWLNKKIAEIEKNLKQTSVQKVRVQKQTYC